jgi:5-(carboxyamino)imidazole ribonucleotide synthase
MIGVLGAGQLGRMLALAGYPLGLRFRFFDSAHEAPVRDLAEIIPAAFDDEAALDRFASGLELVTFEFENVPVEAVRRLSRHVPVYPPAAALEASQDRLTEKTFFQQLGIPTAPFVPVQTRPDLDRALAKTGCPAILKTRRMGYDGKGQCLIRDCAGTEQAWQSLGPPAQRRGTADAGLILEGFVAFDREVSQIAVRGRTGELAYYPLVENHHADGLLRRSLAPAPDLTPALEQLARDHARHVLERLDYKGVLAIEFFQQGEQLIANEMAPRVHNSGHWTIEGAQTSQFENHLRAVLGLPLGSTDARGPCAMLNIIGEAPPLAALLAVPGAHVHLYGKKPRPGRKIGHVTICAWTMDEVRQRVEEVRRILRERVG